MKAWVVSTRCTDGEKVWLLGCTCTSPRRRKKELEASPELIQLLKQNGKYEEVR